MRIRFVDVDTSAARGREPTALAQTYAPKYPVCIARFTRFFDYCLVFSSAA